MALGSDGPAVNEVDEPNPERGSIEWRTEAAGGSEIGALAAAGDVVFVGDGTTVSAFTMADGTSRWQQKLDVGDLAPTGEQGDDMVTTIIHQLAVGDLVAVAVTERTVSFLSGGADPTTESADRTVVAALDPATGAQRWASASFEGGGGFGFPGALELIDDLVVVEVGGEDVGDNTVWAFDAATGSPRWRADGRLAGVDDGSVFVYRQDQCLLHSVTRFKELSDGLCRLPRRSRTSSESLPSR